MKPTILITAPYMLPFMGRFRPLLESYGLELLLVPEVRERLEEEQILAYAGKFDGTLCGDDRYTPRALEACAPRLKVISKWGTGIDSIDRPAAERLGIRICNTPNAFTQPVADTVLGYLLAYVRRQPWMDRAMKAGFWEKLPGKTLAECTLGVVGVGNVGRAVLARAKAFGATLLGNDILPIDPAFLEECGVRMVSLPELLARSDFVSLNCDLNPTSFHLINRKTLSLMKPSAVLINTARGPIVDESALVEALQSGRIAGAALDVYETEPLPATSRLLKMDQVMLAAHNANSSPLAWERVHANTIHGLLETLGIPHPELAARMESSRT